MKALITTILVLFLLLSLNAQNKDTTTYAQFRYDFMNIEVATIKKIEVNHFQWKPALVLVATFALNQVIIMHDKKCGDLQHTSRKTRTVFLIGGALFVLTYSFEIKKWKNHI